MVDVPKRIMTDFWTSKLHVNGCDMLPTVIRNKFEDRVSGRCPFAFCILDQIVWNDDLQAVKVNIRLWVQTITHFEVKRINGFRVVEHAVRNTIG